MEEKHHIRKLQDNNYLGEWDLPTTNEGKKIVTIKKVESAEVIGANKSKSIKPLIYFNEFSKPLVLNATNRKAITTALQSPYIEDWIGKRIELYRVKSLKAFGEILDAIRVKNEVPKVIKETLTEQHPRFKGACESLKNKKTTISEIQKLFDIPENVLTILKKHENESKSV